MATQSTSPGGEEGSAAPDNRRNVRSQQQTLADALQAMVAAATASNAVRSYQMDIEDWETFLLGELPYGQIDPAQLRQGIIERAGLPQGTMSRWEDIATSDHYDEILHWQFGRGMCSVAAALRLNYTYTAPYGQPYTDAILIGYVARQPARNNAHDPNLVQMVAVAESLARDTHIGMARRTAWSADKQRGEAFGKLLKDSSPYRNASAFETGTRRVEFCGLARDNNSLNPFRSSWTDVAADQAKYDQLLYWTFNGLPRRITKAMRISYGGNAQPAALLIGYQGPGPD